MHNHMISGSVKRDVNGQTRPTTEVAEQPLEPCKILRAWGGHAPEDLFTGVLGIWSVRRDVVYQRRDRLIPFLLHIV